MEKHSVLPASPLSRRTLLRRGSIGVLATIVGGLLPQHQASAEALMEFRQARYIMEPLWKSLSRRHINTRQSGPWNMALRRCGRSNSA
jgi:hypothetical protein